MRIVIRNSGAHGSPLSLRVLDWIESRHPFKNLVINIDGEVAEMLIVDPSASLSLHILYVPVMGNSNVQNIK